MIVHRKKRSFISNIFDLFLTIVRFFMLCLLLSVSHSTERPIISLCELDDNQAFIRLYPSSFRSL